MVFALEIMMNHDHLNPLLMKKVDHITGIYATIYHATAIFSSYRPYIVPKEG